MPRHFEKAEVYFDLIGRSRITLGRLFFWPDTHAASGNRKLAIEDVSAGGHSSRAERSERDRVRFKAKDS